MYTTFIYLEDSLQDVFGVDFRSEKFRVKSLTQVKEALATLDGDRFSMLLVAQGPPASDSDMPYEGRGMIVGGGPNQFVCQVCFEKDESAADLCNSLALSDDWVLIRRTHMMKVNKSDVVDRDTVTKALCEFVRNGELADDVCWRLTD